MATTPEGLTVPAATDVFDPQGDMVTLADSFRSRLVYPVADATERDALLGAIAWSPSEAEPLKVDRVDLGIIERNTGSGWSWFAGPPRTVNRWRQMAASNTFTNQTSFAQFPQSGDHSALVVTGFVKQAAGSDLLISMTGTCRKTTGVAQAAYLGVYISVPDQAYPIGAGVMNTDGFPCTIAGSRAISGLPAGSMNIGPRFRGTAAHGITFNTDDVVTLTVQEVWPA